MTEDEAIENLKCYRAQSGTSYPAEIETAIKALEEIQQYRAIGTVEECRAAMKNPTAYDVDAVVEQLEDYSDADEADAHGTIPVIELDRAIEIVKGGGVDA